MTTPSKVARLCAGTYIEDSQGKAKANPVYAWVQNECRSGSLRQAVDEFVQKQQEIVDPSLLLVESIEPDSIVCSIPCRVYDHESTGTFLSEIKFTLNPATGHSART